MDIRKPNFTPRLKKALEYARESAIDAMSPTIDVDHLSLGILSLKNGPIYSIFHDLNVDINDFFVLIHISEFYKFL